MVELSTQELGLDVELCLSIRGKVFGMKFVSFSLSSVVRKPAICKKVQIIWATT